MKEKNVDAVVNALEQSHAIEIKNFTKKFRKFTAVNNINLQIKTGTIHGFIGPNGAGKTTTIKSIVSAIKFKRGQILINGLKNTSPEAKRLIGYIPESARFPKKVSVYEYLIAMGRVSGLSVQDAKQKSHNFLKKHNLWKFKNKDPNSFSSGMKKKVLLNQALLNDPQILILDEPAANLDPTARTDLFNELKKLRDEGKTILISSHILAELQTIVDEITILNKGKVIYSQSINKTSGHNFEIKTNNNHQLLQILQHNHITIIADNHQSIIINLPHFNDIKKINYLIWKNNLIIEEFKCETIDLQNLYEHLVIKSEQKNQSGAK